MRRRTFVQSVALPLAFLNPNPRKAEAEALPPVLNAVEESKKNFVRTIQTILGRVASKWWRDASEGRLGPLDHLSFGDVERELSRRFSEVLDLFTTGNAHIKYEMGWVEEENGGFQVWTTVYWRDPTGTNQEFEEIVFEGGPYNHPNVMVRLHDPRGSDVYFHDGGKKLIPLS